MSYSLAIDPQTGDLVRDADGQIVLTTDPSPELVLAIAVPLGSFHGDPEQGSRLPELLSGPPVADIEAEVEAAATEAIERLEEAGLVTLRDVDYDPRERELAIDTEELADPYILQVT